MAQVGRISGPLLTANLLRNGVDLAFENDLLYLKVSPERFNPIDIELSDANPQSGNSSVGINTDAVPYDLTVNGFIRSTDLINNVKVTAGDVEFVNSTITSLLGNLNISANEYVATNNIRTGGINIDDNIISTVNSNSNLEFRPNGTGDLEVFSNVKINGDVYASGNVTFGDFPKLALDGGTFLAPVANTDFGTFSAPLIGEPNQYNFGDFSSGIIFGDGNTDNIVFAAEISSDIIPDQNFTYSLGTSAKNWKSIAANFFNGGAFILGGLSTDANINLALRPGNSWFVATNGSDNNQGNHENGPFATIEHALSRAQFGDTVYVYPGVYDEVLPLTVPTGVTVTGTDIRTCIIVPDTSSTHSDVFLVNGETTISNLTIKDFFYDSVNNTGNAFRFAPNFKVTNRSPYIQNVTVLTKGSLLTTDDPLGFDQSDAGRGAYIDGSVATSDSKEASLLFHSCTFVTPNVDCITMTNGVRVEWLNSFTYFANKGLYATNGSLGFANLATKFGAEIRSIGSANVYGNYGAVVDGASTLMYLIMHNFAYIGTGKDSSNDNSLHIEDNNAVELNSGKIVYQSTDQKGKFKVGNAFYVDFETGTTSINVSGADITGASSILVGSGTNLTYIDAFKVDLSNLTLRGNDLLSKSGPINVTSSNGTISFSKNVLANKNLAISGNMTVGGQLTFGNASSDTIVFSAPITENIVPSSNRLYSLGSIPRNWLTVYTKNAYFDSVGFINNVVTTNALNVDLQLSAAGIGEVVIPKNDLLIEKNLSVLGPTTIKSVTIVDPSLLYVGNTTQTGDATRSGDYKLTGFILATNTEGPSVQFSDIQIDNTTVTTTLSNSNLELRAAGLGSIKVPSNNVQVNNNVTVGATVSAQSILGNQKITADQFSTGAILIDNNFIKSTSLNADLILDANASGFVNFQKDVQVNSGLTVSLGSTSLKSTTVQGNINHSGLRQQTGNYTRTGNTSISGSITTNSFAQFENIRVSSNSISTTLSNSDLELVANGSGIVKIPQNNVRVGGNVTANLKTTTSELKATNQITADQFLTGNIVINDNYITTTVSPHDLRLLANNIGKVTAPSNSVLLENNLTVLGLAATSLKTTNINGSLTRVGTTTQTGAKNQTGNLNITGVINVSSDAYFKNIDIVNNSVRTGDSNSDLELRAAGTGIVKIPFDNVYLANKISIGGTTNTANINATSILADQFSNGNIVINDNYITTAVGNSNLVLAGSGFGGVKLETLKFNNNEISTDSNNENIVIKPGTSSNVIFNTPTALKIPVGSTTDRPISNTTIGEFRFNTTDNLFSGWRTFGGVFSQNRLTYARAHPNNNTINFVANSVSTLEVLPDRLRLNGLLINNTVLLNNNTISSNLLNSDWHLAPNGTGSPIINEIEITDSQFKNLNSSTALTLKSTADGHIKFSGTYGIVIPVGNSSTRGVSPDDGDLRFNTELDQAEVYSTKEQAYIPITGTGEVVTQEIMQELGDLWALILG